MIIIRKLGVGTLILVTAIYFFIYSAVRYNLTVTSARAAQSPMTIVIDAGHGGEDGGAVSASGMQESDLNLSMALRMEQILALCGIKTSMIRCTDTAVYTEGSTITEKKVSDLKHRVQLVNDTTNAILISIHQNHFSEPKYAGAQVFYAPTAGSEALAQISQSCLRSTLDPGNRRQPKPADSVYLMQQVQCPAILVECGFLSNIQEAALLQTDSYQTKLVCALTCALTQYLEKGELEVEI